MPVVLKIDPQRRVVHSAFYGKVTDAEFLGHHKRIASDPDFNSQFADIVDFSDVTDAGHLGRRHCLAGGQSQLVQQLSNSHRDRAGCGNVPAGSQVQGACQIDAA